MGNYLNKDQILRGTGEKKQNLGNREHKNANFRCLANMVTNRFISGEKGNG